MRKTISEPAAEEPQFHDLIGVQTPEPPVPPYMPPELRRATIDYALPPAEAVLKFGTHRLQMLKDRYFMEILVKAGDTVEVAGNVAHFLITNGKAVSLDERQYKEAELVAEARRLKIPLQDNNNPAFDARRIEQVRQKPRYKAVPDFIAQKA